MATYASTVWPYWVDNRMTTSASTNINIWTTWNQRYCPTYAATNNSVIWQDWVAASGTTQTNYQAQIWEGWNVRPGQVNVRPVYATPPPPTLEQLAAQKKYLDEQARVREARRIKMISADERARQLLLDHLDEKQKRDYEEKKAFDVEIAGKTYRIAGGTHGNVREIMMVEDKEVVVRGFCIPSRIHSMPEADVHLSQKLMIEGAMDEFERIANISVYRRDLAPA